MYKFRMKGFQNMCDRLTYRQSGDRLTYRQSDS